jgi:hypothetical protein
MRCALCLSRKKQLTDIHYVVFFQQCEEQILRDRRFPTWVAPDDNSAGLDEAFDAIINHAWVH